MQVATPPTASEFRGGIIGVTLRPVSGADIVSLITDEHLLHGSELAKFVRRRGTFCTFLYGVRFIQKFKSTVYGGRIFLIHPTSTFYKLGYGFDWTTTSN